MIGFLIPGFGKQTLLVLDNAPAGRPRWKINRRARLPPPPQARRLAIDMHASFAPNVRSACEMMTILLSRRYIRWSLTRLGQRLGIQIVSCLSETVGTSARGVFCPESIGCWTLFDASSRGGDVRCVPVLTVE